jgi:hypothetical protein
MQEIDPSLADETTDPWCRLYPHGGGIQRLALVGDGCPYATTPKARLELTVMEDLHGHISVTATHC